MCFEHHHPLAVSLASYFFWCRIEIHRSTSAVSWCIILISVSHVGRGVILEHRMSEIVVQFNPAMAALACAIGFIGSFAAISLCEQYRLASLGRLKRGDYLLIILVGVSLGSVSMWAVFHIVVASVRLKIGNAIIRMRYNTTLTLISLFVLPALNILAVYIASTDHCFNKSKKDIMDMFINRTSTTYTMGEIKRMGRFKILFMVCTYAPGRLLIGGTISGGSLALMRYLGMLALTFPGNVSFDHGLITLSTILSVLSMIIGFWMFFRVISIFPSMDLLRIAIAAKCLVSHAGVYYIGLAGSKFHYDPNALYPDIDHSISSRFMISGILAGSVLFSFIMLVYVLSDLRGWLLRTSGQLRQADLALVALMKKMADKEKDKAVPTHFQAPLEVVNYTRRYMVSAEPGNKINPGGMVLPPPMFNDYRFEAELAQMHEQQQVLQQGAPSSNTSSNALEDANLGLFDPDTAHSHDELPPDFNSIKKVSGYAAVSVNNNNNHHTGNTNTGRETSHAKHEHQQSPAVKNESFRVSTASTIIHSYSDGAQYIADGV